MTQTQLARLAGIAQANLSGIESGARPASGAMLERLRRAMCRPSQALADHRAEVLAIIEECGAEDPRVFGSVARGSDVPGSDLDILVRVPPENAWRFVGLRPRLERVLGVNVDVVSEGGLTPKHRQILDEAAAL